MCRATTIEGGVFLRPPSPSPSQRLDIRAFYLRLSSSCSSPAATAPAELTLAYHPPIGGAALALDGRALPPAAPAELTLRRVAKDAYACADRIAAAEGARFEVRAGDDVVAAEGVFFARRRRGGEGSHWRVECRRCPAASPSVCVAEVVVLADGGVLMRDKARAAGRGRIRTRLEGIPEETADLGFWGRCDCGGGDDDDDGWEVVSEDGEPSKQEEEEQEEFEMETVRWAMEMGVWAVCLGVGLLATARRFRRKRAFW